MTPLASPARARGATGLLTAAACVLMAGALHAQPLPELLSATLAQHPKVRIAIANARAAGFDVEAARAAWSPRLGVIVDPGLTTSNTAASRNVGDLALRATQLVYDGGKADNETRRQQARAQAAARRLHATWEQLAAQIADAYAEAWKQQRLTDEAQRNVTAHEDLVARVAEIAAADRGRRSDLDQAQARLAQARVTLATRRAALDEARSQLSSLAQQRVDRLSAPPALLTAMPASLNAARDWLNEHPALLAAQDDLKAAEQAAATAAAWRKPRLDVQGTLMGDTGPTGNRRYLNTVDVRIVSSWTGFDGGASEAAAKSAQAQMQAAGDQIDATRRDLDTEFNRYWSAVQARSGRAAAWQALVTQLTGVRDNYWEQFKIGRRSILDLLNVENEIFQARSNALTDEADQEQARLRLLGAAARLSPVLGLRVPGVQP